MSDTFLKKGEVMEKRLYLSIEDYELFQRIKLKINARKDVEVLRQLMNFFLIGEWVNELLDNFKKEIMITLQNQDNFQEPFPRYLSL